MLASLDSNMAITALKIHPAIGIARVGNSPEYFYGPERPFAPPDPSGGFKDSEWRIKRQAVRFRIYAYHDNGPPTEVTAKQAKITWTVHVANIKAGSGSHKIDPGARSIGTKPGVVPIEGTFAFAPHPVIPVYLGELRIDRAARLTFLGGFGTSGTADPSETLPVGGSWYDDVCDGPVTATVSFHEGQPAPPVTGAWVVVGPPKFAPQLDSVVTLYDELYALAVKGGFQVAPPASYWEHIFPILERARASRWVTSIPAASHDWTHPVTSLATRQQILARLRFPSSSNPNPNPSPTAQPDMPALKGNPSLTAVQYQWMQQFADPGFTAFAGSPPAPGPITPEGLDRAALEACVGASLAPGVEVGSRILTTAGDPFRVASSLSPGFLTEQLERPWQVDFHACAHWWPIARPDTVTPRGQSQAVSWAGNVNASDMFAKWHLLGFVLEDAGKYVEVERLRVLPLPIPKVPRDPLLKL